MSSFVGQGPVYPFSPGTKLGNNKFEIRGIIGEGGMGVVYDAEQAPIGRRVAIKVLHEHQMRAFSARERFRLEALLVAQLQHPNIVVMHDAGLTDDDLVYLVFEYLSGRPLSAERGAPLEAARAINIAQQICRALAAAHAAGIVHRDLKPSNVHLIELEHEPDFVKLLDFGIAKSIARERSGAARLTNAHQRLGTRRYMSPEQFRDEAVDHRADLYALGCVLFEMLMGVPPFTEPVGPRLVEQHLVQSPPRFRELRPDAAVAFDLELEAIARILLQKRPEDRFPSAAAVEAALADWTPRARAPSRARAAGIEPAPPASHAAHSSHAPSARSAIAAGGTATDDHRDDSVLTPEPSAREPRKNHLYFVLAISILAGISISGALIRPSAPADVRLHNLRVEVGRTEPGELDALLRARKNDITRCYALAQDAGARPPTLRLRMRSSAGSTTIRAFPDTTVSQRFADCVAALDPPLELPASRTYAVYSADVGLDAERASR